MGGYGVRVDGVVAGGLLGMGGLGLGPLLGLAWFGMGGLGLARPG